jgi:hypothetical protein
MDSKPHRDIEKAPGSCVEGSILNRQVWLSGMDSRMTVVEGNQAFIDLKVHCGQCDQCLKAYNAIHKS